MKTIREQAYRIVVFVVGVILLALGIVRIVVTSLGNIQATSAADQTPAQLLDLLIKTPTWLFFLGAFACLALLLWPIIRDAGQGRTALQTVKSATDKAYSFEHEFRGLKERVEADENRHIAALERVELALAQLNQRFDAVSEQAAQVGMQMMTFERAQHEIRQNFQVRQIQMLTDRAAELIEPIGNMITQRQLGALQDLNAEFSKLAGEIRTAVTMQERELRRSLEEFRAELRQFQSLQDTGPKTPL